MSGGLSDGIKSLPLEVQEKILMSFSFEELLIKAFESPYFAQFLFDDGFIASHMVSKGQTYRTATKHNTGLMQIMRSNRLINLVIPSELIKLEEVQGTTSTRIDLVRNMLNKYVIRKLLGDGLADRIVKISYDRKYDVLNIVLHFEHIPDDYKIYAELVAERLSGTDLNYSINSFDDAVDTSLAGYDNNLRVLKK